MRSLLVQGLVLGLLAAAPAAHAEVTESFEKTVALDADGVFEIGNINGSIEVNVWDRAEVRIDAVKSARTAEALAQIKIAVEGSGNRVKVEAELPKGPRTNGSVSYRITAPRAVQLQASTVNGPLAVNGVEGDLNAQSVNGSLAVSGASSRVRAKTVNGSLEVRFAQAPRQGDLKFSSVNGTVKVILPADAEGEFHAKTVNGSIRTDFPLQVTKAKFGPMSSLDGTVGSGEASFEIDTVNGAIRILNSESTESKVRYKLEQVGSI